MDDCWDRSSCSQCGRQSGCQKRGREAVTRRRESVLGGRCEVHARARAHSVGSDQGAINTSGCRARAKQNSPGAVKQAKSGRRGWKDASERLGTSKELTICLLGQPNRGRG